MPASKCVAVNENEESNRLVWDGVDKGIEILVK